MKTAIQMAIENAITAQANDKKDTVTYQEVIDMLTEFLPTEKEQIVEANHCGQMHGEANGGNSIDVAEDYYQETYKS